VPAHNATNARVFDPVSQGLDDSSSDLDILVDPTPQTSLFDIGAIRRELKQLISDLALSFIYDHRHQFSKNHIFVAPHAREASGDNAIPQVLAEVCALVAGAKADTDIVQTTKVFHTGGGCQYSCRIKLVACQPIPTQAPQFLVNKSTLP